MTTDLSRYIVNPGPKVPVSGLTAAVAIDPITGKHSAANQPGVMVFNEAP